MTVFASNVRHERPPRRITAIDFFTPSALWVLRVVGALSAIGLGIVLGAYIYRAGYERGMANAQPTFAGPSLYRWLAGESDRASALAPRRGD